MSISGFYAFLMDNQYLFMENVDVLMENNNKIMDNLVLFMEKSGMIMENSAGFPSQPCTRMQVWPRPDGAGRGRLGQVGEQECSYIRIGMFLPTVQCLLICKIRVGLWKTSAGLCDEEKGWDR
jgi:hypothetical protein